MNQDSLLLRLSKKNILLPKLLVILVVLLCAEGISRAFDAYELSKKNQAWSAQTVVWRDQTYTQGKPNGVYRILLLGGSAVHDTVKDYKQSWPYLLEQRLREMTGKKIELINMGFYSECSVDELFKLNEFGVALKPDLVIVFDGENDVYNFWHHFDYWKKLYEQKNKPILHQKKHGFFTRFFGNIRKNCSLYQRLNQFKKSLRSELTINTLNSQLEEKKESATASTNAADTNAGPSPEQFFEDRSRWDEIFKGYVEIYQSNLDKMARLIQKAGAKGLFIFQPDLSYKKVLLGNVTEAEAAQYLKVINRHADVWEEIQKMTYPEGIRIMRDTAAKYQIPFEEFNEKMLGEMDMSRYFEGNVHFSEAGRKLIVDTISRLIIARRIITTEKKGADYETI